MLHEVRVGVRQIRRHPGYAGAVLLTLALSVGTPSAIFTLADPMLFRPLPYPGAERIVTDSVTGKGVVGLQIADCLRPAAQRIREHRRLMLVVPCIRHSRGGAQ